MQAAVLLGVSEEELEKLRAMPRRLRDSGDFSHSNSRISHRAQERGGLVSGCWSISRAKWFFKPSSGQLKFHVQAPEKAAVREISSPSCLRAGTDLPPAWGRIFSQQMFLMLRWIKKKHLSTTSPNRVTPISLEAMLSPTTARPRAPAAPSPRATSSRHLLE